MATGTESEKVTSDGSWLKNQAPRWLAPLAMTLAIVEGLLLIGQAGLIALTLSNVLIDLAALGDQGPYLLGLILVLIGRGVIQAMRSMLAERASAQVRNHLRLSLFQQLCLTDPAHSKDFETGALAHQLSDRVDKLDPYYARFVPQQFSALLIPVLIVLTVTWINWLAGLLLAIAAPIIPLFMALIGIGAERLSRDQATVTARLSGLFYDRLRGLSTIQRFGASERVIDWLSEAANDYRERTMKVLRVAFLSSAVLEFFSAVAIASLAIYVGLSLIGYVEIGPSEQLTLASGLFILLLAPDFFLALRQLAQHWHDRADALAAASDLRQLYGRPAVYQGIPEHAPAPVPAASIPEKAMEVRLESIQFAYPNSNLLFDDLSLHINAGERVLIKGPSGSGKSTMLTLLAGLGRPQRGIIRYGDADIAGFGDQVLSRHRGWLNQSSAIFDNSLRMNITLGRANISDKKLIETLALCGLGTLLHELADGLNTRLGDQGSRLSGGQARRVALARTLLEPRPLLLLDEPSEHLDAESEAALWHAIETVAEQQPITVIAVSHRARAERWAHRQLTMLNGRIVNDRAS